jgi:hypothetical protein
VPRWRSAEAREPEHLAPHLAEIRCPVRLVLGTAPHQGGVESKQVDLLRAHLPVFAVDSVPGAGQYLFEEQPGSVVSIISSMMPPRPTTLGAGEDLLHAEELDPSPPQLLHHGNTEDTENNTEKARSLWVRSSTIQQSSVPSLFPW